jgi:hypothetical protein
MLRVSTKNKNIICGHLRMRFLKYYPEYEGTSVTHNQLITFLLKIAYDESYHQFTDDGKRYVHPE